MTVFSEIPLGAVIPVFFDSFAGSTGASITITGLAVTDIEIYKGTSMTQRSSDSGYVLLDTDGIDLDGITGIQGFSIDTGDNADVGFFVAGSFYNVVVSAITVDAQTVNFVAHRFRLKAAENTAGVPVVDTVRISNTVQTARDIGASVLLSSGTGTGQLKLASGYVAITWADVAAPTTALALTGTTISTSQVAASVTGNVGGNVVGSVASVTAGCTLTSGERTSIADAQLNRDMSAVTVTNARSPINAFRFLRNKWSISGTTLTVTAEDDSTEAWHSTVTATAGADPITANDPA